MKNINMTKKPQNQGFEQNYVPCPGKICALFSAQKLDKEHTVTSQRTQ
jgi:hypothetical protein